MAIAWSLADLVERVWLRIGAEQSEAEKSLYYDDIEAMAEEVLHDVARLVAATPELAHVLQATYRIPVVASLGAASLIGGTGDGRSPDTGTILSNYIYQIEHESGTGEFSACYPLANPDEIRRPQPLGRIWYSVHDYSIETIATDGTTRYTSGGNTLTGFFLVKCNFIPTIGFPLNSAQLQVLILDLFERRVRAKLDPRVAMIVMKEMRVAA